MNDVVELHHHLTDWLTDRLGELAEGQDRDVHDRLAACAYLLSASRIEDLELLLEDMRRWKAQGLAAADMIDRICRRFNVHQKKHLI